MKATIYTVNLRDDGKRGLPHSIVADDRGGAWIAVAGNNEMTRWHPGGTPELASVAMRAPNSMPHTPTIGADGRVWIGMPGAREMGVIDPVKMTAQFIRLESVPHTLSTDKDGNIWGNGSDAYRLDPKTNKVAYWPPVMVKPGPTSFIAMSALPGQKVPAEMKAYVYHIVRDDDGIAWYTVLETGGIVRLDPATGKSDYIQLPGVASVRGVDVDGSGNVWVADWTGGRLVRYEPRTGQSTFYALPTAGSQPYSVFVDKKRGYVWTSDYAGNNLARLDPATRHFVEYPLPHNDSYPRFLSIDSNGLIWFAEWWNNRAGLLDPGY